MSSLPNSLLRFGAVVLFCLVLLPSAYGDGFGATSGSLAYYQGNYETSAPGKGTVGPDGAVHYQHELGFVSACYSSNASKANAWRIAQASSIQRDVKWGLPAYTDDDIFVLDGQELVLAGGVNPRVYHTRDESYCRVEYYNPGAANSYWRITDKSGHVRYYGENDESRIMAIGKSPMQPRAWAIARETDAFELTKYRYENDTTNGSYYLIAVIKGKTASFEFTVTKVFYETSNEPSVGYRTGSLVRVTKRTSAVVEAIGCDSEGVGGAVVRAYSIAWSTPSVYSGASLVGSITEYGSDAIVDSNGHISSGSSLPPTTFSYSSMNLSYSSPQSWTPTDSCGVRQLAPLYDNFDLLDLDGDGRADRIKQGHVDWGWAEDWDPSFRFQLGTSSGFSANASWDSAGARLREYADSAMMYCTSDYFDVNGDGLPDRVWQSGTTLYFRLNTGTGFGPVSSLTQSVGSYLHSRTNRGDETYSYLDINGDGWVDRVWQDGEPVLHVKLADPKTGQFGPIEYAWPSTHQYLRQGYGNQGDTEGSGIADYMDMNGDGLVDRIWQDDNATLNIRFGNGSGFEDSVVQWASAGSFIRKAFCDRNNDWLSTYTATDYRDFNGDGLPDRLVQDNAATLSVYLNTGNGFGSPQQYASSGNYLLQPRYQYHPYDYVDLDGNGILDRVYFYSYYTNAWHSTLQVCLAQSTYPVESYLTSVVSPAGGTTTYSYKPINHDLNLHYRAGYWVVDQEVTGDGLGSSETNRYEFEGGKYDVATRTNRGFCVVRRTGPDGNIQETHYHQDDLLEGQVQKVIEKDSGGRIEAYSYNSYQDYSQNTGHYGHAVSQDRQVSGPTLTVRAVKLVESLSYVVDGTTTVDLGTQPSGAAGVDWTKSRTTCQYDDWGNLTFAERGDFTSGSWGNDKEEAYAEYINDNSVYWRFVPKRRYTRQFDHLGAQQQSSETRLYYDNLSYGQVGAAGLVTRDEQYYDPDHFVFGIREYDNYGNLWKATDGRGNTTTYSCDSRFHAYLTSTTTPQISSGGGIQLVTSVEYDSLMRPYRSIDPNGIATEKRYDPFGRLIKEIAPGDTENLPTISVEYHQADGSVGGDGSPCAWTMTRNRILSGDSQTLSVFTYYDGLGRVVQSTEQSVDSEGFPGFKVVNRWEYVEGSHRVSVQSMPYVTPDSVFSRLASPSGQFLRTDVYFDPDYGRARKITQASGATSYEYSKHNWARSIDAQGQEVASELVPGVSERRVYTYEAPYPNQPVYRTVVTKETFDGIFVNVKDASGTPLAPTLELTRDWLSRKTEYKDPDMGRWVYRYDDCGNLVSQTDNNRQETLFEYDELNRLTSKIFSDSSSVSYSYDVDYYAKPGVNNYSRKHLTRLLYSGGEELFLYDTRGRLQWQSRTIEGHTAEMGKSFDAMNRQTAEIYPDGEVITYAYDGGGNLTLAHGTKDLSTTTYVSSISYTSFGKMNAIQYGNGLRTAYDYYDSAEEIDPSSGTAYSYKLREISSSVLDLRYEYDVMGNVKRKYLDLGAGAETYTYDAQNRLTNSSSDLYGNLTFAYDRLNNIVQKDGRTYAYGTCQAYAPAPPDPLLTPQAGPHAVTNDGAYTYGYDLNGNVKLRTPLGQGAVREFQYDADNHLASILDDGVSLASFLYDSDGNRIRKTEGSHSTYYFFPGYEEDVDGSSTTVTKYYFVNGLRVAQRTGATEVRYLHFDHLNSTVRISDASGQLIRILGYKPFGEEVYQDSQPQNENLQLTGSVSGEQVAQRNISLEAGAVVSGTALLRAGNSVSFRSGSRVAAGASLIVRIEPELLADSSVPARYRYTGHERESNGLDYCGARFYDPALGTFLQPDFVLDGLNRYTYCGNNPVKYNDPTGNIFGIDDWLFFMLVVVGAYVGGAVANNDANPLQWDYSSPGTWLGIIFGGVTGGIGAAGIAMLGLDEASVLFEGGGIFVHMGPEYENGESSEQGGGAGPTDPSPDDLNMSEYFRRYFEGSYENQELSSLVRTLFDVDFPTAFFDLELMFPIAPEDTKRISSYYGFRRGPKNNKRWEWHPGWDFAPKEKTKVTYVVAAHSGYVHIGDNANFGKNIMVNGDVSGITCLSGGAFTLKTQYSHLKTFLVKEGQWVNKGERIGVVGNTGYSTGPHLDFRIFIGSYTVNPRRFFH